MKGLPIFLIVALIAIVFASLPPIAFTADDPFVCPADAYRPLRVRDDELRPTIAARAADARPLPRSIALWGDSHLAAPTFAAELQRVLEARGLAVRRNFIAPYFDRPGVGIAVRNFCASRNWRFVAAYATKKVGGGTDFGPALAKFETSTPDAYLWLDLRDADGVADAFGLRLAFEAHAADDGAAATVELVFDDDAPRRIALEGDAQGVGELTLAQDRAIGTLRLRVLTGRVALRGIAPWRPSLSPQTVRLDVFAIPGATVTPWSDLDPAMLAAAPGIASPELVVLEYGTNEANNAFEPRNYRATLSKAVTNLRAAFPQAECVLLGPPDRGVRARKGRVDRLRHARLHARINEIQAQIAVERGCRHFDWQRFMGGAGSAYEWARARPALMSGDLTHLSRDGTRRSANAFANFLGW
mgnify:CR=1 FL=1